MSESAADRRARFRELHERDGIFLLPNPWDIGSARLLASLGFEALATTSAGLAWSLGKLDQSVTRDALAAHVAALSAATTLPLNVDSERCYPDEPGGVEETVRLLAAAGAAGFSIEDYNPSTGAIDPIDVAVRHVELAVEANRQLGEPLLVTGRAENHIRDVDDVRDTIARLVAYRDAGADVVYAPGLTAHADIAAVVAAVGIPVNVLARPAGPTVTELAAIGVKRVSTGGALASHAYAALVTAARELLATGTSRYVESGVGADDLRAAFSQAAAALRTDR